MDRGSGGAGWGTGAWVFPVALWFLACFFLLGRLGLWLDDYYYIQRTPETLAVEGLYLQRPIHFWRPLYKAVVPGLLTAFWRHDAALHLLGAGTHALVAGLLWRLLWTLGVNRLSAGAAALLFLAWPVHSEPVFWVSALPTGLAAALALATLTLAARWAGGGAPGWSVALVPPAFFTVACLNEQPAALALALPFVVLAAAPEPAGRRARARAGLALALGAGAVGGYVACSAVWCDASPAVGYEGFAAPAAHWPGLTLKAAAWAADWGSLRGLGARAWERGLEALGLAPPRAGAALGAVVAGAALWARARARDGDQRLVAPRHAAILALGATMTAAPWAPVVALNYWLNPRLCYTPDLGLAVLLAAAGSMLGRRAGRWRRWAPRARGAVAAAVAAAAVLCSVMTLGAQRAFQARSEQDRREMAELRRLWPSPPPGAVFAPAALALPLSPRAGPNKLDDQMWSALSAYWSARWVVRLAYRRSDLDCGHATWRRPSILGADRAGASVEGVGRVPWRRLAPFVVGPDGSVRAVTAVRVTRDGAPPAEFRVPLGESAARAAGQGDEVFELPR